MSYIVKGKRIKDKGAKNKAFFPFSFILKDQYNLLDALPATYDIRCTVYDVRRAEIV